MSNTSILLLFAIINVVVTGLFAGVVLSQYIRRRRNYQLYWSIALIMAFLATLTYILMVIVGPTTVAGIVFYRIYYILGAALAAAWLGLGSIALVASPRVTRICLIVLSVLSVIAIVLISISSLNMSNLGKVAGTAGAGILESGAALAIIPILNIAGLLAVAGVAVYSGWKLARRQSSVAGVQTINLLWANVLILVGVLLVGLAGGSSRLGLEGSFWIIQASGWTVLFVGVLIASRRPATATQTGPEKARMPV